MNLLRQLLATSKVTEEATKPVVVTAPKPRNKQLNDGLKTRKGGRHTDRKADYSRTRLKQTDRKMCESVEGEEGQMSDPVNLTGKTVPEVAMLFRTGKITYEQFTDWIFKTPEAQPASVRNAKPEEDVGSDSFTDYTMRQGEMGNPDRSR